MKPEDFERSENQDANTPEERKRRLLYKIRELDAKLLCCAPVYQRLDFSIVEEDLDIREIEILVHAIEIEYWRMRAFDSIYTRNSIELGIRWIAHEYLSKRGSLIDMLLLIVVSPDAAEAAAGDLIEEYGKVKARRPLWFSEFWLWKEFVILWTLMAVRRFGRAAAIGGALRVFWKWIGS